jgi:5-methylcytosine-specific restriction endonuclease McrA
MHPTNGQVARVQLLLDALFLSEGGPEAGVLGRAPLQWISEWLGLEPATHFGDAALRHLVAIQLAPRAAIAYDRTNPKPRWRLIREYLAGRFALTDEEEVEIARLVAAVLDQASSERGPSILVPEGATECAICRLPFRSSPMSVTTRDPYKPTWQAPDELCRPEIDHVVPISGLGQHRVENLQVVCRACNLAKGSGLIVDPDAEIRYAALDPSAIPRVHLFRLLQWLIRRRGHACASCDSEGGELTMRPVDATAPIARGTLTLTCYSCA